MTVCIGSLGKFLSSAKQSDRRGTKVLNNEDLLRTSRTAQQLFPEQAWQSEFYTQHPCRSGRIELLPQRCALTSTLQHTHTERERIFLFKQSLTKEQIWCQDVRENKDRQQKWIWKMGRSMTIWDLWLKLLGFSEQQRFEEREKENNVCWEKLEEWEVARTESSQWLIHTFSKKGLEKKLLSSLSPSLFNHKKQGKQSQN